MSANANPILPCEKYEVTEIRLTQTKKSVLANYFIPPVEPDKTHPEKGFAYEKGVQVFSLSP